MEASGTPERKALMRSLVQKPEIHIFLQAKVSIPKIVSDKTLDKRVKTINARLIMHN